MIITKQGSGWKKYFPREPARGWCLTVDEKKPFGELNADSLYVGDIVEWSVWNHEGDCWNYNYGLITEIKNEIRSNRMVSISKVLPLSGDRSELEHFSVSLRLVSRSGEIEDDDS